METSISTNQRIVNTLLLNSSFIDNLGLLHGKMGISIYFFHLARQTENKIYEDYAGELIDEIYEEITANTPSDFENGMAGIGWGIEYLVQNGFIEADTDEVLEEFDNRIFKELIYNTPKELGLLNGLLGIGAYFLKRIQNLTSNDEKLSTLTNKQTIIHIIDELERRLTTIEIEKLLNCEPEKEEVGSRKPEARSNETTETLKLSNHFQTSEQSNPQTSGHSNSQTLERPSNNRTIFELSNSQTLFKPSNSLQTKETFDITWDYPVLIWFLAQLYEQNIFNFKVEKIINRLIEPLNDASNLPKLQSNRLLLTLSLTKLEQTLKHSNSRTLEQSSNIKTISNNLYFELNRKTIKSELTPNNATLRHGTSGIAWVYKQLFKLTGDSRYKKEMEHWTARGKDILTQNKYNTDFGDGIKYNKTAYGILEGDAGITLNQNNLL